MGASTETRHQGASAPGADVPRAAAGAALALWCLVTTAGAVGALAWVVPAAAALAEHPVAASLDELVLVGAGAALAALLAVAAGGAVVSVAVALSARREESAAASAVAHRAPRAARGHLDRRLAAVERAVVPVVVRRLAAAAIGVGLAGASLSPAVAAPVPAPAPAPVASALGWPAEGSAWPNATSDVADTADTVTPSTTTATPNGAPGSAAPSSAAPRSGTSGAGAASTTAPAPAVDASAEPQPQGRPQPQSRGGAPDGTGLAAGGADQTAGGAGAAAGGPAPVQVVVAPGDSLWQIAERQLPPGHSEAQVAAEWPRWWGANREVVGDDPHRLLPGQVLLAPGAQR